MKATPWQLRGDSPHAYILCTSAIIGISLVLILLITSLYAFIIPIAAVLIPLKLFGIEGVKKIFIMGAISILVIATLFAGFQTYYIYDQEPDILETDYLKNGSVENLYGDMDTTFYFSVDITTEVWANHTVYLNITYPGEMFDLPRVEGYEMEQVNSTSYRIAMDFDVNPMNHYFSVYMEEGDESLWNETDKGFGPVVISRSYFITFMFLRFTTAPFLLFILLLSLVWWKQQVRKGKLDSTLGLEDKESALDDSCPRCGELLDGKDECSGCDWERSELDKKLEERERKYRIECPSCGVMIDREEEKCDCGWDVQG